MIILYINYIYIFTGGYQENRCVPPNVFIQGKIIIIQDTSGNWDWTSRNGDWISQLGWFHQQNEVPPWEATHGIAHMQCIQRSPPSNTLPRGQMLQGLAIFQDLQWTFMTFYNLLRPAYFALATMNHRLSDARLSGKASFKSASHVRLRFLVIVT